jgi:hypothetical protein
MQITNFRDYKCRKVRTEHGDICILCIATVDITSRTWYGKKITKQAQVFQYGNSIYWRFMNTGELCPIYTVTNLEVAYRVQNLLKQAD